MGQKTRETFKKREKEKERQQKQVDKETRRMEAKKAKAERKLTNDCEDQDIAGIVPGPQPLPEQWHSDGGRESK